MYDENLAFDSPDPEFEDWLDEIAAAQAESEMEQQYTFELQETAKYLAGGLV